MLFLCPVKTSEILHVDCCFFCNIMRYYIVRRNRGCMDGLGESAMSFIDWLDSDEWRMEEDESLSDENAGTDDA